MQVLLDDILIYSQNDHEHKEHLRLVLHCLRDHKLYRKLPKCTFFQNKIQYLGHTISGEGISVDSGKVESILSWKSPRKAKEVPSFMGLAGYYRRFMEGFSKIASPVTNLQKKGT